MNRAEVEDDIPRWTEKPVSSAETLEEPSQAGSSQSVWGPLDRSVSELMVAGDSLHV